MDIVLFYTKSTMEVINPCAFYSKEAAGSTGAGSAACWAAGRGIRRVVGFFRRQKFTDGIMASRHGKITPRLPWRKNILLFKKYPNFVGNYGNAWWKQKEEFERFHGPILMTTNCIVPPKDSYKDRLYTTGAAGYPGCTHIDGEIGAQKDFSALIEQAKHCSAPEELEHGEIIGGFAHNQVLALASQIVEAVNSGAIKKFVVMAGCDGRANSRNYYTDFARALPKDAVILTAGCAKGPNRSGNQHSHLFVICHSFESGTNRYFGLSESHITTH